MGKGRKEPIVPNGYDMITSTNSPGEAKAAG